MGSSGAAPDMTGPHGAPGPVPAHPGPVTAPGASPSAVPPARDMWVPRVGLVRELAASREARLVLLAAPPGYGKSTLLAQWAADPGESRRFAWVALEPEDDDPAALWTHVHRAVADAVPGAAAVDDPRGEDDVVLTLTRVATDPAGVGLVLVLDDYQVIRTPECHAGVARLLRRGPPGLQVVVATRADPALPLGRLRAEGELVELRMAQLRFTGDAVAALVHRVAGRRLDGTAGATLLERTEGWPAGVSLAAQCLRDADDPDAFVRDFAGDHRFVVEYLAEEVLRHLPDATRRFVVRTSVLDRLCAPLCQAVLEDTPAQEDAPDAAAQLDALVRSNLFLVPLDAHGRWFRYQNLFAEALRSELARTTPGLAPVLHARAARWHDAHGSPDAAVRHAFAAGDTGLALDLVVRHMWSALTHGRTATVRSWRDALGDTTLAGSAAGAVLAAWVAGLAGHRDVVETWLAAAERRGHTGPMPDGSRSLESAVALVRAVFALGGVAAMQEAAARAVALEDEPTSPWYAVARYALGVSFLVAGDPASAVPPLEQATRSSGGGPLLDASVLAALSLAVGDLGEAARADVLAESAALTVASGYDTTEMPQRTLAQDAAAASLQRAGRLEEAHDTLEHALAVRRVADASPLLTAHALCRLAEVRTALGDPAGARAAAAEARRVLAPEHDDAAGLLTRLDAVGAVVGPPPGTGPGDDGARSTPGVSAVTPLERLTDRERAILRLLQGDQSLAEIGRSQFVSANTVKTHVRAVYRKLGVSTRAQAVARGRALGLLASPPGARRPTRGSHPGDARGG
jgi:LuxR family transcriptional regulator, maltose regulon positive regulatory protein